MKLQEPGRLNLMVAVDFNITLRPSVIRFTFYPHTACRDRLNSVCIVRSHHNCAQQTNQSNCDKTVIAIKRKDFKRKTVLQTLQKLDFKYNTLVVFKLMQNTDLVISKKKKKKLHKK